jgi:hypothetical protein
VSSSVVVHGRAGWPGKGETPEVKLPGKPGELTRAALRIADAKTGTPLLQSFASAAVVRHDPVFT